MLTVNTCVHITPSGVYTVPNDIYVHIGKDNAQRYCWWAGASQLRQTGTHARKLGHGRQGQAWHNSWQLICTSCQALPIANYHSLYTAPEKEVYIYNCKYQSSFPILYNYTIDIILKKQLYIFCYAIIFTVFCLIVMLSVDRGESVSL